ncbi:MAG: hypothetical protein B6I22_11960, partial [Desulfobacteraceae bacterium 4572_123]
FMTQVKYNAFTLPQKPLNTALKKKEKLFQIFTQIAGKPLIGNKITKKIKPNNNFNIKESLTEFKSSGTNQIADLIGTDRTDAFDFLLLAYLDSAGYSERSKRKSPQKQFHAILERYIFVVKKIQHVIEGSESNLATADIIQGDARLMELADQSIDGVLFSPPYSFAINYLANDSFHLNFMGENIEDLKEKMIGLRGRTIKEKYSLYVKDMDKVLSECARVLKPSRFCTIIVGTNDNQLSKALNIPKEQVTGLHKIFIDLASKQYIIFLKLM